MVANIVAIVASTVSEPVNALFMFAIVNQPANASLIIRPSTLIETIVIYFAVLEARTSL